MYKLLSIYNTTYHSRIKCSPAEMFNDPALEKEYIFSQLEKKEEQEENVKDLHLKEGMFVRYILPRANGRRKRYQISRECYRIESVKGNIYTLIAKDGTTKDYPRYKLIPCSKDGSMPMNIKWADTFPDKWNGVVTEIRSYNPRTQKYTVVLKVPHQPDYIDEIPATYLRGNYPQQLSEIERAYMTQTNS